MRLGVFAKTFAARGALASLSAVRAAGFSTAQFNMTCLGLPAMPEAIDEEAMRDVAAASAATGVALAAISGTYNMVHPDARQREAGLRRLAVLIAAAPRLGARQVTLCTGTRDADDMWRGHPDNATPEAWRDLREQMAKAVALAEARGVDLGVEPELANVVNCAAAAKRLLDEVASPRLRIVLDPANLFEVAGERERRALVEGAVDLLAGRIAMAHAKDRDARGAFVAPGRGVIDFRHFIHGLRASGFDGPVVAHGFAEGEAPEVARFLKGALAA